MIALFMIKVAIYVAEMTAGKCSRSSSSGSSSSSSSISRMSGPHLALPEIYTELERRYRLGSNLSSGGVIVILDFLTPGGNMTLMSNYRGVITTHF